MTKFAFWIAALGVGARFECGECAKYDLTSSHLKEGGTIVNEQVFKGFGCTGGNVSPDLSWSGAPSRTKSFAVSIYDPDAPTVGWWQLGCVQYFTRYDVVAQGAGDVRKKLMPKGAIQSRTDFGADGYGGPCPPTGDKPHHYQVTALAVDVDKLLDAKNDSASAALVGFDLHFHTLAKAH
jgi:Raf kinase inhibitor-like YbhB/YbcL family protein